MIKKFKQFKNLIIKTINNFNTSISKRKRKLHFMDIVYCVAYINSHNVGYNITNSHLKNKKIVNVSKSSLVEKRCNIDYTYFTSINDIIINHIYKNYKKPRFIAVDGSHINLFKCLSNYGTRLSRNKKYSSILLNSLYDIDNKIPINYMVDTKFSERSILYKQLKYIHVGDVLIMDRGYFCQELLNKIININADSIFRLKNNINLTKEIIKSKKNDIIVNYQLNKVNKIQIRLVKYKISKHWYYLCTTLINRYKYPLNRLIKLYKKRWTVETDFLYAIQYMKMDKIKSKKYNNVKQDIASIQFVSLISSYIEYILKFKNKKYKINKKNSLSIVKNDILYTLLYKKNTKNVIKKLKEHMNAIKKSNVCIQPNRHYSRIRKMPASKWCLNPIKFYNKFKKKK